jgi:phage baseplate assembly protein gpV
LDSGYWEVLSTVPSQAPIRLQAAANVTSYQATGQNAEVQTPLMVLVNGPQDTPPGSFYDGGPFSGFEGTGFIGASGLNKWAYPDGQTYRSVRLKPVNVAGKTNVHLTVALAATVVDFEDSDFVDIVVYPNGATSTPVTLAHFRGVQNAVQPWLADQRANFVRRLTRQFADFTYDIPPGATDLIVEVRAATTWWTEIAAIDNIRITAGTAAVEAPTLSISRSGANVTIAWKGGTLESATTLGGAATQWTKVDDTDGSYTEAAGAGTKFFRVRQ